jgi:hypothetical protein
MIRMPMGSDASGPLQVLAAAVTPVVLVSATAILISGVNSRYIAIADRMRALAHEYRSENCLPARQVLIRDQIPTFRRRIELVAWAVRMLYVSVACFIIDALIISATAWRSTLQSATLPFFLMGIMLILISIILELVELHISGRTIKLEISDVIPVPSTPSDAGSPRG